VIIVIQTGFGIVLYGLKKKSKSAIYIKRKGDKLFFIDGDGNVLSEKIIINKS
jgi:hypothetical protein